MGGPASFQAFLKIPETSISNRLDGTEDDALLNPGIGTDTDSDSEDGVLGEPYCDLSATFAHSDSSDEEFVGFDYAYSFGLSSSLCEGTLFL